MSLSPRLLLAGGLAALLASAVPASAQVLGDADCPGGYYFYPVYGVCVPYGYVYVPDNASPDLSPQFYGPTFLFLSRPRDHDHRRDGDHARGDDRYRR